MNTLRVQRQARLMIDQWSALIRGAACGVMLVGDVGDEGVAGEETDERCRTRPSRVQTVLVRKMAGVVADECRELSSNQCQIVRWRQRMPLVGSQWMSWRWGHSRAGAVRVRSAVACIWAERGLRPRTRELA